MSGFEIIGVILAVYPLVASALTYYKATRGGKGAASLSLSLKIESIIFDEFVYKLLAPNAFQDEQVRRKGTASPDLDLWKDPLLQEHIKSRLGSRKAEVVVEILEQIKALLSSLELEFSPIPNEHTIELLRKFRAAVRNVKQNLPRSNLKESLDELTAYNQQLQRLWTDRSLPTSAAPPTKAVPAKKYLRRDCSRVVDIYNAICNGYQCNCEAPHVANFGLPELLDNFRPDNKEVIANVQFDFLFPTDELGKTDKDSVSAVQFEQLVATWSELRINPPNIASQKNASHSKSHSICICECSQLRSGGQQGPISDLCILVRSLNSDTHVSNTSLGVLRLAEKQYEIQVPLSTQDGAASPDIICLDDLLSRQNFKLSRKERMNLALRLSCAILEFYSTPWIETGWTWKDFCIDKRNNARLFVTQKFYSSRRRALNSRNKSLAGTGLWAIHGEPILTRLGFALIELAMGKRLAELRPKDQDGNSDPDTLDFLTARDLIRSGRIQQEEGLEYENVVKICLDHEFLRSSELIRLDSGRSTFQDNVEQQVIAPLHKIWTVNWGA